MIYNTQKGKNIAAAKRMSLSEFIERSHIKHNHKYTYEEVTYVNAHTHINIKCPDHGIWSQTPMDHLTGCGCPICGNIQKGKAKSLSAFKKFLEEYPAPPPISKITLIFIPTIIEYKNNASSS